MTSLKKYGFNHTYFFWGGRGGHYGFHLNQNQSPCGESNVHFILKLQQNKLKTEVWKCIYNLQDLWQKLSAKHFIIL